jgi:putative heme-binding domain-containing protein
VVRAAGPLEMPRLLSAFERSTDAAVGMKLVAALRASASRSSLRSETLRPLFSKYGVDIKRQADDLYASLDVGVGEQNARIDDILSRIKGGDVRRGQAIFNGQKAACSACHAIGYLGGNIGPDLTRIGQIRTERDLLESIVYPSASFVRSFAGVVRRDAADEIVLVTVAREEVHIPREDVQSIRPATVSIMPAGLDQQLTIAELADLLAFLKATKW